GDFEPAAEASTAADPEPAPAKPDERPPERQEIAFGAARWSTSALPTRFDVKTWTEDNLSQAIRWNEQRGQPVLPAFFPIALNGKLVYRTYDGIYALNTKKEGKLEWFSHTDGGVMSLLSDPNKRGYLDQWNQFYRQNGPQGILFQNSALGALTIDNARAF